MTDDNQNALQLSLVGDIHPQQLRSNDLSEVIAAYEDAVAAMAAKQHPGLKPEGVTVSLVRVEEGSVALTFGAVRPDIVYPAAYAMTDAIAQGAWSELPLRAIQPIRRLIQFLQQHSLAAELRTAIGAETIDARLAEDTVIPPAVVLYGATELVVEVKRVGGVEPRAMLVTQRGDTLFCRTTEAVAKQLASQLYDQVRVRGAAQWDFETLAVVAFEIEAVLPFQRVSPVEAFAALREQFGGYFDSIEDPDEWMKHNRQG